MVAPIADEPNGNRSNPIEGNLSKEELEKVQEAAFLMATDHAQLLMKLRDTRVEAGIPLETISHRMAIPVDAVARMERYDAAPTLRDLEAYALAVGMVLETSLKPYERIESRE